MAYRLMYEIEAHKQEVVAFCNCEEGRFATSSFDRKIKLWQLNDALPVVIRTFTCVDCATILCWIPASDEYPSGGIAAGGPASQVFIWDLSSGESYEATRCVHKYGVTGIVFDSAHNLLTSSPEGVIRRFRNGSSTGEWQVQDAPIKSIVRFDEQRFLIGSTDRTIKLWQENGGEVEHTYEGHTGSVQALAVTPLGTIIYGSFDGTIRSWDSDGSRVISERPVFNLTGINAIHVNPRAPHMFVMGSQDGFAEIWNLSGQSLQNMKHPGSVLMLSFLPDGSLLCCCSNGYIYLWTTNDIGGHTYSRRTSDDKHVELELGEYTLQCNMYTMKYSRVKVMKGEHIFTYSHEELGSGGFGCVWKGRIPEENPYGLPSEEVAIKFAKSSLPLTAEIQLENEIRMLGMIGIHNNIAQLKGHGETPAGERFLVMELANPDLSTYLRKWQFRHTFTHEPNFRDLKWKRVWAIIRDIARSLQFLHDQNIRHGDIKPANLLLQQAGARNSIWKTQLTDFGLSCVSHPSDSPHFNGEFSSGYIDPNLPRRDVGDDTYSFGIIALQLLTREAVPLKVRDRDLSENLEEKKRGWIRKLRSSGCRHPDTVLDFFLDLTASPEAPGAYLIPRKDMSAVTAYLDMLDFVVGAGGH